MKTLDVIFRMDRPRRYAGAAMPCEVTAVFPSLPGSRDPNTATCYARIDELESNREAIDRDAENETDAAAIREALQAWDDENAEELKALKSLADQAEGYATDWSHGETLIRDSYFKEYAAQLADDIGAIDRNASWPLTYIDWDRAARELQQDYTAVEFDGITYWIR